MTQKDTNDIKVRSRNIEWRRIQSFETNIKKIDDQIITVASNRLKKDPPIF